MPSPLTGFSVVEGICESVLGRLSFRGLAMPGILVEYFR
jgi:hypothetical protein